MYKKRYLLYNKKREGKIVLKKSGTVGISVSPEKGLELAQIDFVSGTVLKYGCKPIDYNIVRREISDLDLFKDSLQDLLEEQAIPKGTEVVLTELLTLYVKPTTSITIQAAIPTIVTTFLFPINLIRDDCFLNPLAIIIPPFYSFPSILL